jgi:hypothetical protein
MYDAMDLLHAHAEQVEKTVFFQTANLFNLEVDLKTHAEFHSFESVFYHSTHYTPSSVQSHCGHAGLNSP